MKRERAGFTAQMLPTPLMLTNNFLTRDALHTNGTKTTGNNGLKGRKTVGENPVTPLSTSFIRKPKTTGTPRSPVNFATNYIIVLKRKNLMNGTKY